MLAVAIAVTPIAACGGNDDSGGGGGKAESGSAAAAEPAEREIRQVVEEFSTSSDPAVCDLGTRAFHEEVWGGSGANAIAACRTQLPRLRRSGQASIRSLEVSGSSASAEVTFGDGEEGEYTLIDTQDGWRLHGYLLTKEGSNTGRLRQKKAPAKKKAPAFNRAGFEAKLLRTLSGSGGSSLGGSQGPKVTDVSCPPDIKPAPAATVECKASGQEGLAGPVTVTFQDDQGRAYKYKAKLKAAGFTQTVSGTAR